MPLIMLFLPIRKKIYILPEKNKGESNIIKQYKKTIKLASVLAILFPISPGPTGCEK